MLDCSSNNCLKVSKFHAFFRKNRKKSKNYVYLIFECFSDNCLKVSKFHAFFKKNRKKVEKLRIFDD